MKDMLKIYRNLPRLKPECVEYIVLHCSVSPFGNKQIIREWHMERGFSCEGYHKIIGNGRPIRGSKYSEILDGMIENGRPLSCVGAHVRGYNPRSIGVCLIGGKDRRGQPLKMFVPSEKQMKSLKEVVKSLLKQFPNAQLVGHYEMNPKKGCPLINMDDLRVKLGLSEMSPAIV